MAVLCYEELCSCDHIISSVLPALMKGLFDHKSLLALCPSFTAKPSALSAVQQGRLMQVYRELLPAQCWHICWCRSPTTQANLASAVEGEKSHQLTRETSPVGQQEEEGFEWPLALSWSLGSSLSSSTTSSHLSDPGIALDRLRQSVAQAQHDRSTSEHTSHAELPGMSATLTALAQACFACQECVV